jgi:hypothetical protein
MKTAELPARSLLYVLLVALGCEMQPGGSATIVTPLLVPRVVGLCGFA